MVIKDAGNAGDEAMASFFQDLSYLDNELPLETSTQSATRPTPRYVQNIQQNGLSAQRLECSPVLFLYIKLVRARVLVPLTSKNHSCSGQVGGQFPSPTRGAGGRRSPDLVRVICENLKSCGAGGLNGVGDLRFDYRGS